MSHQANKKRTDVQFNIGDLVWVKLQPYRQHSIRGRHSSHKLSKRYYGPFSILEKIGNVAYKLQLPPNSKIHNVFHVGLLKKCTAPPTEQTEWPSDFINNCPLLKPDTIIRSRSILRSGTLIPQVLVKWKGQDENEATWEDTTQFQADFPEWNHEGVVSPQGGSTVTINSEAHVKRKGARQRIKASTYPTEQYMT